MNEATTGAILGIFGATGSLIGVWLLMQGVSGPGKDGVRPGRLAWCLHRSKHLGLTLLGAMAGAGAIVSGRIESIVARAPMWIFGLAGLLALVGMNSMRRSCSIAAREIVEHHGRRVEAATGSDQFGSVLWENYVEVGGYVAKLEEVAGRVPPAVRAPADERARVERILVRGELREGAPIWVHLDGRWQVSGPAERGNLSGIAKLERLG